MDRVKQFLGKSWIFLTAAGVITVCTVLLAQSVLSVNLASQNQVEKVGTIYAAEPPGEEQAELLPMSTILPALAYRPPSYTLGWEYARQAMEDDLDVMPPTALAEQSLQAVEQLFDADLEGARVWLLFDRTSEGVEPESKWCRAYIYQIEMNESYQYAGVRYSVLMDAETGVWSMIDAANGHTASSPAATEGGEAAQPQEPELPGGWHSDPYPEKAVDMTGETYAEARKKTVLRMKTLLDNYVLNGRTVAYATAPGSNGARRVPMQDGGAALSYDVVLSDGESCNFTFSLWPDREPVLKGVSRDGAARAGYQRADAEEAREAGATETEVQ